MKREQKYITVDFFEEMDPIRMMAQFAFGTITAESEKQTAKYAPPSAYTKTLLGGFVNNNASTGVRLGFEIANGVYDSSTEKNRPMKFRDILASFLPLNVQSYAGDGVEGAPATIAPNIAGLDNKQGPLRPTEDVPLRFRDFGKNEAKENGLIKTKETSDGLDQRATRYSRHRAR